MSPPQPTARSERFGDIPGEGAVVGDCLISSKIGEGGMAVVYKALRRMLKRTVALKLLPPAGRDPSVAERFLVEAQAAASLDHPHIVRVYNTGTDGPFAYIEMELVEGGSLSQRLRNGALPEAQACRIVESVGEALAHAHAQGLVHRDVKPDNIMLTREGAAKLTDFGLAGRATAPRSVGDDTRDAPIPIVGTIGYMAPDAVAGLPVDGRSDQYSLAATLYYALARRLPFEGGDPASILVRQLEHAPPDVRKFNPEVSDRTWRAIERALARDPAARFESCRDFAAALRPPAASGPSEGAGEDEAFWKSFSQLMRGTRTNERRGS